MITDNTPILIASSQVVVRDINTPEDCRSPILLAADAVRAAVSESHLPNDAIDTIVMTRIFIDCVDMYEHPFGSSDKPPRSVAELADLKPRRAVYGTEGGQSPQRYVNEFAESIYRGDSEAVVICGAEAVGAMKHAQRQNWALDWRHEPEGDMEDRGFKLVMSELEMQHHISFPPQVYALFENAWRHERGLSVAEHRQLMGKLFARFSEIAANNPYAQFPTARTAEFLATPSPENYAFNEPYNKWMVAQDAVNLSAAVVMTSVGKARELGVPESQWVFLHGYADADDKMVSKRQHLASSDALKAASKHALAMADKPIDDIELLDIYSCFPIAVFAACDALGISLDDERDLTLTGGLPFFGGPGNSYSLNAIAEMYQRLAAAPGTYGLISANGGYLSKESVGIYSTTPTENWQPAVADAAQKEVDDCQEVSVLFPYDGEATLDTYCVVYTRSQPTLGLAIGSTLTTGERVLMTVAHDDQDTLAAMIANDPIGRTVQVSTGEHGAHFRFGE